MYHPIVEVLFSPKFESFLPLLCFAGEPGLVPAVAAAADGRGPLQAHVGGAEPEAAAPDWRRPADLPARVLPPISGRAKTTHNSMN